MLSGCPFVHPSVSHQTCEHNILITNESIFIQIGKVVHGPRVWNDQLWGSGGQRSRSYEAKDKCGGLVETSVSTPLGWVAFLLVLTIYKLLWQLWHHEDHLKCNKSHSTTSDFLKRSLSTHPTCSRRKPDKQSPR